MSKDYKPAPSRQKTDGRGSPFLSGLLVGLLLGIGLSLGVAIFVKQGANPFQDKLASAPAISMNPPLPVGKPETAPAGKSAADQAPPKKEDRFTFYGILTGSESAVSEQEIKQAGDQNAAAGSSSANKTTENYFLQVGAYQTEQEADNMKAKLALMGMEAVVQTVNIPDKGVLHRVRVGPLTNIDELNKARSDLARNGFDATIFKIPNVVPDQ